MFFCLIFSAVLRANRVDEAVAWAVAIANDDSHGYDQGSRWGPDYDCSSFIITAFEQAGIPVKSNGATVVSNMPSVFEKTGFSDVTSRITLSSGSGLQKGDVLIMGTEHTALVASASGSVTLVYASENENSAATGGRTGDQNGKEIRTGGYYNSPWTLVLRYTLDSSTPAAEDHPDHLFTVNQAEIESAGKSGYKSEGIAFYVNNNSSATPVYRAYNGEHFYTTSQAEIESAERNGYKGEGIAFYTSNGSNETPVYRLYNSGNGDHLYTTSQAEVDSAENLGYKAEGIAFHTNNNSGQTPVYRAYHG